MSNFSDGFVHNLVEKLNKTQIPSNMKKESDLELAIYKIVRNHYILWQYFLDIQEWLPYTHFQ
jgi:hypothetical protein